MTLSRFERIELDLEKVSSAFKILINLVKVGNEQGNLDKVTT